MMHCRPLEVSRLSTLPVPKRLSTSVLTGPLRSSKSKYNSFFFRSRFRVTAQYSSLSESVTNAAICSYFKNDTLAMIGYGSQGHGQSLNARDNGLKVIVGVRKGGESWKQAQEDGWVPGETLFDIPEAINKGTIIMNLLSDAAQSQTWSEIAPLITKGKTLYFAHGFSVVYKEDVSYLLLSFGSDMVLTAVQTHVIPPKDVDVILVAPKGSGRTVRTLFLEGRGINSSIAVYQDVTGHAKEKAVALGIAVGSGYLYETTFEKEVYSDLYGERGVVSIR